MHTGTDYPQTKGHSPVGLGDTAEKPIMIVKFLIGRYQ